MNRARCARLVAWALVLVTPAVRAQIRVSPSSVNVSSQSSTTVFINFAGLRGGAGDYTPAEGFWCGALISAIPDRGLKCDPGTLYGLLPSRFNQSRFGVTGVFTDVMSIPASVARRAYQAAEVGGSPIFYYVRRFVNTATDSSQYVTVTMRLAGGGAGVAFALTDVRLAFAVETPVLFVHSGDRPPPLSAEIRYTGTGRLQGRWEVVLPGEQLPEARDLLTEATLPPSERSSQRRYRELSRFNVFLPPTGRYTLPGPDVSRLPTTVEGGYQVLLRIEASDDGAAASMLGGIDSTQAVPAGAVAGFPLPVLRYFVGSGGSALSPITASAVPRSLSPADNSRLRNGRAMEFRWTDAAAFGSYRLEIEREDGATVFAAVLPIGSSRYHTPPWLAERAAGAALRWRVVVLDASGWRHRSTEWRRLKAAGGGS